MTGRVRRPVAAGAFYPGDPGELAAEVDRLTAEALPPADVPDPVGLVVPHAGYRYSGPVAGTAYALLAGATATRPERVVLIGPSHFVGLRGVAVASADAWATPLGMVDVDAELRAVALRSGAVADDGPHAADHALEVQLPFLQRVLGTFSVLPVAVGDSEAETVAALIGALAGEGGFIVVSTDLSHYLDHTLAGAMDRRTADAILSRDPASIRSDAACGVHALRGLVEHASRTGLGFALVDLRTSGDTAGDRRTVMGYGAFAMVP